jgi:hypothetical protein
MSMMYISHIIMVHFWELFSASDSRCTLSGSQIPILTHSLFQITEDNRFLRWRTGLREDENARREDYRPRWEFTQKIVRKLNASVIAIPSLQ